LPIEGVEWAIVFLVILIMLLWKPEKIGDIGRAIANAKREFEKAQKELSKTVIEELEERLIDDRKLLEVASKLGIKTSGLTRDEIRAAIAERISKITDPRAVEAR